MTTNKTGVIPFKIKLSPPHVVKKEILMRKQFQVADYRDWLYKIVHVSAPAGYGKSMLLWQWYQQVSSNLGKAWLNIDIQDNEPLRLIRCIARSCQQGLKVELSKIQSMLDSIENIPAEYLLDALLTELEEKEAPLLLFIDDIHLISRRKPLALIKELLHRAPPYIGFVIAGRARLRANLSRLKANQRLLEFNVSDLNFNESEIKEFFAKAKNNPLTNSQLTTIRDKTEGWAAGMQLVVLACEEQSIDKILAGLSGSFTDIADYLGELVFQQQFSNLQDFLLKSSVLERFNVDLCRAVVDQVDVHRQLDQVKTKQLFLISLDSNNEWYRYHHLFQDYLQQQLRQNDIKEYQNCLMRASEWCEQENLIHEAIDYALKGKLYDRTAYLLSEYGLEIWIRQFNYEEFQNWLMQIPRRYFEKWPLVTICAAHLALSMASYNQANQYIKLVDEWLLKNDVADNRVDNIQKIIAARDAIKVLVISICGDNEVLVAEYQGWRKKYPVLEDYYLGPVYASLASRYIIAHEYQQAEEMARQVVDISCKMKTYVGFTWGNIKLILIQIRQGNFIKAKDIAEKAVQELEDKQASYFKKFLYPLMLYIAWEQGKLDAVDKYLHLSSIQTIEKLNSSFLTTRAYIIASRIVWLNQDEYQAQKLLQDGQRKVRQPYFLLRLMAESCRQLFLRQDVSQFSEMYESMLVKRKAFTELSDVVNSNIDEIFQITQLQLLFLQNKLHSALELLHLLFKKLNKHRRYGEVVKLLVIKARISHQMNDNKEALAALEQAFKVAIPNSIMMTIIEEGSAIKSLVEICLQRLSDSFNTSQQLNYCQKAHALLNYNVKKQNRSINRSAFYETLTERENSILQRLDSLLTRNQLAAELNITTGTLKWHLTNLYQKLQATNRHAAVIQAKKFGLLS